MSALEITKNNGLVKGVAAFWAVVIFAAGVFACSNIAVYADDASLHTVRTFTADTAQTVLTSTELSVRAPAETQESRDTSSADGANLTESTSSSEGNDEISVGENLIIAASAGELLYKFGFISGSSSTEMKLDEDRYMTRAELTVIAYQLSGGAPEDLAFAGEPMFLDSLAIPAWAKPYVAYAQSKGLVLGDEHLVFDFASKVTGRQLAVFLLRMLGRGADWNTAVSDIGQLGIALEDKAITRGEAFECIWQAVSLPVTSDGEALGIKLGKLTAEEISACRIERK